MSGWRVFKISDLPEDLESYCGFRVFCRRGDGTEHWIASSGNAPENPTYHIRKNYVLVALRPQGTALEHWVGGLGFANSGKSEGLLPDSANTSGMEFGVLREGNLLSLIRILHAGTKTKTSTAKFTTVYLEFFKSPMTEDQKFGNDLKLTATAPGTPPR
jgi:hypothetical protein